MELIVVSPESEYDGEVKLVEELFRNGLTRYHLRKLDWGLEQCEEFLVRLPSDLQSRISIHQHHALASAYPVGTHFKEKAKCQPGRTSAVSGPCSRSLHRIASIESSIEGFDYAFLSPIFPSISKEGYGPSWTDQEFETVIESEYRNRLFALGGIDVSNAAEVQSFGFKGIALHGAVWRAADPVGAFQAIRREAV